MKKETILTVDDDQDLQLVLGEYLKDNGYNVVQAFSGEELEQKLPTCEADVILLDLILPDTEGLSLISKIRGVNKNSPIIIVSGKNDTTEKIIGLEMGADDYMTKPFEMRELSARIKAVLRRSVKAEEQENRPSPEKDPANDKIHFYDWVLDRSQFQVLDADGQSLDFTIGEFKLLEALIMSANRALSRDYLFELTRDGEFDAYDRAIDIQVARIRKKLGGEKKASDILKTVRGVGYMFVKQEK